MPPATRAKSAAVEAPKLKPLSSCSAPAVSGATASRTRKQRVSPPRPKETTTKPITEPAVKATCSPLLRLPTAHATVVRTLASVATSMPIQPASALRAAPAMKDAATRGPSREPTAGWIVKSAQSIAARSTTNLDIWAYSSCKKAIAPDLICAASSSNRGTPIRFPVECRRRRRHSTRTKRRQRKEAANVGLAIDREAENSGTSSKAAPLPVSSSSKSMAGCSWQWPVVALRRVSAQDATPS
mmetsp:Transcript_20944/g.59200  ORF Transcript_20944/g.59200 Transcript_20944/m.59200 type:complete len:242 (+) Transcript_20944:1764-2489(+)